ncbi:hypothetical protein GCM10011409_40200 [Lentibacillus populi]|uniref:Uncharacterized protein n=1 Tax=Lentibacillus populi TaxID=1827502 RepID=A0A9W5X767_9BACI|nr:hypothetical protein GCM10011409_40200 [Lentibacillus populi]
MLKSNLSVNGRCEGKTSLSTDRKRKKASLRISIIMKSDIKNTFAPESMIDGCEGIMRFLDK